MKVGLAGKNNLQEEEEEEKTMKNRSRAALCLAMRLSPARFELSL